MESTKSQSKKSLYDIVSTITNDQLYDIYLNIMMRSDKHIHMSMVLYTAFNFLTTPVESSIRSININQLELENYFIRQDTWKIDFNRWNLITDTIDTNDTIIKQKLIKIYEAFSPDTNIRDILLHYILTILYWFKTNRKHFIIINVEEDNIDAENRIRELTDKYKHFANCVKYSTIIIYGLLEKKVKYSITETNLELFLNEETLVTIKQAMYIEISNDIHKNAITVVDNKTSNAFQAIIASDELLNKIITDSKTQLEREEYSHSSRHSSRGMPYRVKNVGNSIDKYIWSVKDEHDNYLTRFSPAEANEIYKLLNNNNNHNLRVTIRTSSYQTEVVQLYKTFIIYELYIKILIKNMVKQNIIEEPKYNIEDRIRNITIVSTLNINRENESIIAGLVRGVKYARQYILGHNKISFFDTIKYGTIIVFSPIIIPVGLVLYPIVSLANNPLRNGGKSRKQNRYNPKRIKTQKSKTTSKTKRKNTYKRKHRKTYKNK